MGLFTKVKDILFEEEEVTQTAKKVNPVKKEEKVVEEVAVPKAEKKEEISRPTREVQKEVPVEREIRKTPERFREESERDTYKNNEKNFPFPEFDEEEFSTSVKRTKPKSTNVLDYERKKKVEKRNDYSRLDKVDNRDLGEKRKFKPSPIISPVYGILNEDYTIDDIKQRPTTETKVNLDEVRKRAFESEEIPTRAVYEEDLTVKLNVAEEEKIKKVKTIDDLLEDTSDVILDVKPTREQKNSIQYEEIEASRTNVNNMEMFNEEDTLENDLFDLIDSMYEQREDGDY